LGKLFTFKILISHQRVISVTQTDPKTKPTSPAAQLEYAINLARAGQKIEARDILRQVVAQQPVNQAAWLWLSAVAADRDEAEAALAQARKINGAHPSLAHAEQWLAHRFSSQPSTKETAVVTPPLSPASSPSSNAKNLFR
jgi:predicted Zn-dependent protease